MGTSLNTGLAIGLIAPGAYFMIIHPLISSELKCYEYLRRGFCLNDCWNRAWQPKTKFKKGFEYKRLSDTRSRFDSSTELTRPGKSLTSFDSLYQDIEKASAETTETQRLLDNPGGAAVVP